MMIPQAVSIKIIMLTIRWVPGSLLCERVVPMSNAGRSLNRIFDPSP